MNTSRDHKKDWIAFIHELQDKICHGLEEADGKAKFREDKWVRPEGGGGITRVISDGNVFEKGGVNISEVYGTVTEAMKAALKLPQTNETQSWFACGLSLVLHPYSPMIPTVHCNYRMFELYDATGKLTDRWFGGGTDLTPYYIVEDDIRHFHRTYKHVCDGFDPEFYPSFRDACDHYFVNVHRGNERRGVGGIFYDYKRPAGERDASFWMDLGRSCGEAFLPSYLPIVDKQKNTRFSDKQKHWQEIRRGRYVEFNLVQDRGTLFGLKTNGRIESILMSLPPTVRFEYDHQPEPGSDEERLLEVCRHPVHWI